MRITRSAKQFYKQIGTISFLFSMNNKTKMNVRKAGNERREQKKKARHRKNERNRSVQFRESRRMEESCVRYFHSSYFIFFFHSFLFSHNNDVSVLCCLRIGPYSQLTHTLIHTQTIYMPSMSLRIPLSFGLGKKMFYSRRDSFSVSFIVPFR